MKQAALIGRAFTCDKFGNTFDGAILVLVTVALFIQHSRALLDLDLGKAASDLNKDHLLTVRDLAKRRIITSLQS